MNVNCRNHLVLFFFCTMLSGLANPCFAAMMTAPSAVFPMKSALVNPMGNRRTVETWQIHQKTGERAFLLDNLGGAKRELKAALRLAVNHEQRIHTLVVLSSVYENQQDFSNQQRTMLLLAKELNTDKDRILLLADVYTKLGFLETAAGGPKAEPYYRTAVSMYEKTSGRDSFEYASSLLNLAELERVRHQLQKADNLMQKAVRVFDSRLGRNSYISSVIYSQLGDLNVAMRRQKAASQHYFQAWRGFNASFGPLDTTTKFTKLKYFASTAK
jgi:hypothetical protein